MDTIGPAMSHRADHTFERFAQYRRVRSNYPGYPAHAILRQPGRRL
jgi:hypothetical protein